MTVELSRMKTFFGGSRTILSATNYIIPGTTAVRVWAFDISTSAKSVVLPDARKLENGFPVFVILNWGSYLFTVRNSVGTSLGTISPGYLREIGLISNITQVGTWLVGTSKPYAKGSTFATPGGIYSHDITRDQYNLNLRTLLDTEFNYDGVGAVNWTVTIKAGVTIGGITVGEPSLEMGTYPTGSSITLIIEDGAYVDGRGGVGGYGGLYGEFGYNPEPGADGDTAFKAVFDCTVSNYGAIRGGGGGGGGGGSSDGAIRGGGGGGGQGRQGGSGGASTPTGGYPGTHGNPAGPGEGGASSNGAGGDGGAWGTAGDAGVSSGAMTGGAGGAAGYAVEGNSYVSWSPSGTILGAQV